MIKQTAFLAKSKLNSIEILTSKDLMNLVVTHDELIMC